jgi:hypothetical protein
LPVLPRALARAFLAVLRKAVPGPRAAPPTVLCRAGPDGLTLTAGGADVALRYHDPTPQEPGLVAFAATALALFGGPSDDPVTLTAVRRGRGEASWEETGARRSAAFEAIQPEGVPPWPDPPAAVPGPQPGLLGALAEAAATAARAASRYALGHVLLRGHTGEVVGTDSKQLLVHAGFRFPWADDVLVPRCAVWASRELARHEPATVGLAGGRLVVTAGPWSVALAADPHGRFPPYEQVIPRAGPNASRWQIHPDDVADLGAALARLPGTEAEDVSVTLELDQRVVLRAAGDGQVTEVVAARSAASGPTVRVACPRRHLVRALRLGFTEVVVNRPDAPLLARDARRRFVWMPLSADAAAAPNTSAVDTVPAAGPDAGADPDPNPNPIRSPTMPLTPPNGHAPEDRPDPAGGLAELIAEAEQVRSALLDAASRLGRWAAALRQQRKQSKAFEQAVQSLRRLRAFDP